MFQRHTDKPRIKTALPTLKRNKPLHAALEKILIYYLTKYIQVHLSASAVNSISSALSALLPDVSPKWSHDLIGRETVQATKPKAH